MGRDSYQNLHKHLELLELKIKATLYLESTKKRYKNTTFQEIVGACFPLMKVITLGIVTST